MVVSQTKKVTVATPVKNEAVILDKKKTATSAKKIVKLAKIIVTPGKK